MRILRLPYKDPRTVARDIPGISEILFPGLVPALITYLNRSGASISGLHPIPEALTKNSSTSGAMLYEIAYVVAEKKLNCAPVVIEECIGEAIKRQSRFFDAVPPKNLSHLDLQAIELTSENLVSGLLKLAGEAKVAAEPAIPGMGWISSGVGDFAFDRTLVEIKCSSKNFSANDYRQLLLYWLLKYASVIETRDLAWSQGILFNPRRNKIVRVNFSDLHSIAANDRTLIETLELVQSIMSPVRNF